QPPPGASTLSLHDALPICSRSPGERGLAPLRAKERAEERLPAHLDRSFACQPFEGSRREVRVGRGELVVEVEGHRPESTPRRRADRKSTCLNSSHVKISYA